LRYHKQFSKVAFGFLTVSLITTSLGGIFTSAVFAADAGSVVQEDKSGVNKDLLGGLLAVGAIALVANHGGSHNNNSANKSNAATSATTSPTTTTTNTATNTSSQGTAADEQLAFKLLNADRAKNGLSPLKLDSQLTTLGGNYAQDMINRNFFSHTNPEGQTPFDRMKNAGISYTYAGENIAINNNVTAAETAFMNSSGHKANILNANYTDVGIGVRYDSKGSAYVVQEFIGK
jgi:uncharacterized protein YkwD